MSSLTGGDVVVEALAQEGVKRVFSVPGGQLLTIYDSIGAHPEMELIVPRHEGAGALMAAGYSLAAGGIGVCISTVGAGVIYEAPGLLFAFRERLPVISIAPQVQSWRMKPIQESLQACDQDEIFRPFTKFRAIVYHYDRVPQLISRAIRAAMAPEPGPVHLDIPVDVLFEFRKDNKKLRRKLFPEGLSRFEGEVFPDPAAMDKAVELILGAERPLVMVGRGVERERAGAELAEFLEQGCLPVLSSTAAFASIKTDYRHGLGAMELWQGEAARKALSGSDLIVLVEADEEAARLVVELKRENPALKVIQSARQAQAIDSLVPVELGMVSTARAALRRLGEEIKASGPAQARDRDWPDKLMSLKPTLERQQLERLGQGPRLRGMISTLEVVSRTAGPEDYVICEGARAAGAALCALKPAGLHHALLLPDDYIPGAGLPLALGVRAARPQARVFLISETGRFKRHSRELQTARRYGLPVMSFLFQERDERPEEEVDFAALAESFGVSSRSVIEPEEEITEEAVKAGLEMETGRLFDASR